MERTPRLYDALMQYLSQSGLAVCDVRHLQTLCWMMIGIVHSHCVNLNRWGCYTCSRAQIAQSHQRRFRRWLSNRRVDVNGLYTPVIQQALVKWGSQHLLYLSLDTTLVWNQFCIVWLGVVYRGRTVAIAWSIQTQASSSVRLRVVQRVLCQGAKLLPNDLTIVLLADRGFADIGLMKYLRRQRHWHFRIRIKCTFTFEYQGRWQVVKAISLKPGQVVFAQAVRLGKTKSCEALHLAFAHDQPSGEFWAIVSDEPTNLQTFAQYRLRFQIEENFLDLKSNAFDLETCRIRDVKALNRLCAVIALTMLFLTIQGTAVVANGLRRQIDPHWNRGMSYLKLGWNWLHIVLSRQFPLRFHRYLSGAPDPEPAMASEKQRDRSTSHEFKILSHIPVA